MVLPDPFVSRINHEINSGQNIVLRSYACHLIADVRSSRTFFNLPQMPCFRSQSENDVEQSLPPPLHSGHVEEREISLVIINHRDLGIVCYCSITYPVLIETVVWVEII